MSDKIQLKVKFEGSPKVYTADIYSPKSTDGEQQKEEFIEQIKKFIQGCDYETPEKRMCYFIYNVSTQLYIITYNDLVSEIKGKKEIILKDCTTDAKEFVEELNQIDFLQTNTTTDSSGSKRPDVKKLMHHLGNHFYIDVFVEEFLEYGGIKYLVTAINETTGNSKAYAMNALRKLFEYKSSIQYMQENLDLIASFYDILVMNDNSIKIIEYSFEILKNLIGELGELGKEAVQILVAAAEDYAKRTNTKPYEKLIHFLLDGYNAKNVLLLINMMITLSPVHKQAKLLSDLEDVGLIDNLIRLNEINNKDYDIQTNLTLFQEKAKKIISGSFFDVERIKKENDLLSNRCKDLENKIAFIFLNQKVYDEIVNDFIVYKKLSDCCNQSGGYYSPEIPNERYDSNLQRSIKTDKDGKVELQKVIDDYRADELTKIRNSLEDMKGIKKQYDDLHVDFENMRKENKALKDNIQDMLDEDKNQLELEKRRKIIEELNNEKATLEQKMNGLNEQYNKMINDKSVLENKIDEVLKERETLLSVIPKFDHLECESLDTNFYINGIIKEVKVETVIDKVIEVRTEIKEVRMRRFEGLKIGNKQVNILIEGIKKEVKKIEDKKVEEKKKEEDKSKIPLPPSIPSVPQPPSLNPIPLPPSIPSVPQPPSLNPIPLPPSIPSVPMPPSLNNIPLPPSIPNVPMPPSLGPPSVPMPPSLGPPKIPGPPGVGFPRPPGPPGIPSAVPGMGFGVLRPQPTKPKIVLKTKVKPLQWTRVLLLPPQVPNRPNLVWNNITEDKVNPDEIVSLFEVKKTVAQSSSSKPTGPQKKRFLDDKRTQSVGITIAKLPPPDKVELALSSMDITLLKKSQIDSLYKEFITKEEYDNYISMGEDGDWDKGEKYLVEVNKIPNAKIKLNIWSMILDFDESYPSVVESFSYMQDACKEIKDNSNFKKILATALTIGNILNGGTVKGQADGFALDLLPKLSSIKDNNNHTVLQWICAHVKKQDETFEGLKEEFPQLIKASGYSIGECTRNLNETKKLVSNVEKNLNILPGEDEFITKSKEIAKEMRKKVEIVEKKSEENIKVYQTTAKYFGYTEKDSKYKAPEEFFRMLVTFFDEVEKSMPKPEVKKVFKSKNQIGQKLNQKATMSSIISQLKSQVGS